MRNLTFVLLWMAALPCAAAERSAILWQQPGNITTADFVWGLGGEARAPKAPFQFLEEDLKGTDAKVKIVDAKGGHWTVKFGRENHGEVIASRLLFALGYVEEPMYLVPRGVIAEVHGLKRAKPFLDSHGGFRNARFKLRESRKANEVEGVDWSWRDNPFTATHELNGLKILMMLMSNWDAKDSRDGKSGNTTVYSRMAPNGDRLYYAFDDWGSTFGKWGGFFSRDKWNVEGYKAQSRNFVRMREGKIVWGYRGKHGSDLTTGIGPDDVRWLLTYLAPVTDNQIRAGLQASGATPFETDKYVRSIRDRILQLQEVAAGVQLTRAETNAP